MPKLKTTMSKTKVREIMKNAREDIETLKVFLAVTRIIVDSCSQLSSPLELAIEFPNRTYRMPSEFFLPDNVMLVGTKNAK